MHFADCVFLRSILNGQFQVITPGLFNIISQELWLVLINSSCPAAKAAPLLTDLFSDLLHKAANSNWSRGFRIPCYPPINVANNIFNA